MPKKIKINERDEIVKDDESVFQIKDRFKHDADLIIYNGFPLNEDLIPAENDIIVFIKKGEIPEQEELEALMMSRHTPGVHEKIKNSAVGIAGIGGLGSAVAIALVRVGIGKLILVDFDIVEPSNLNRQQFFIEQIGQPKVKALKENLIRINPFVDVEIFQEQISIDNIANFFNQADVIIEAFDRADQKTMIINAFKQRLPDKILIIGSGLAGFASNNTIRTVKFTKNIYLVGDQVEEAGFGIGLMAPRVGIAAHHQANAALRYLVGQDPAG